MNCPVCGRKMYVSDNTYIDENSETYRKLKCKNCNHEMYTVEFEVDEDTGRAMTKKPNRLKRQSK